VNGVLIHVVVSVLFGVEDHHEAVCCVALITISLMVNFDVFRLVMYT
jgi:hypothetical protein